MKPFLFICSFLATIAILAPSCKSKNETIEKVCKCCTTPVITKVYEKDTIVIYNAFTPDNEAICDSTVDLYDSYGRKLPVPPNLCHPNKDTIYNDHINQYFYIKGIQKFYNQLIIKKSNDTIWLNRYFNYSNTSRGQVTFDGNYTDTTKWGNPRFNQLSSQELKYELTLYKDELHKEVLDYITGTVCIVRTPNDCDLSGCTGHDADDPLLKKK